MNEDELQRIHDYVGQTVLDPDVELQWIEKQLGEMHKFEQEAVCLFKLNKYMRRDEQMKANEASIQEARAIIEYLTKEQARIKGVS
jgi:hypothetical protein